MGDRPRCNHTIGHPQLRQLIDDGPYRDGATRIKGRANPLLTSFASAKFTFLEAGGSSDHEGSSDNRIADVDAAERNVLFEQISHNSADPEVVVEAV